MYDFKDQRVIVTGGTRGIGKGIVEAFLKAGATVIATYAGNDDAAKQFKEANASFEEQLDIKKFDVTDTHAVKEFYSYLDDKYESIEVLVNNSGIRKDSIVAMMSDEDWNQVINTNLGGTFNMTRECITRFLGNRYGRIINISSVGGALGLQGQANYAASKAGQIAISKSLSKEVGKKGITVNNILPRFIETELLADLPSEQVKEYKKQVPLKRFGRVEEVAHGVLFLASKEASYISGASLEISGGL